MELLILYLFGFVVTFLWFFIDYIRKDNLPVELLFFDSAICGAFLTSFLIALVCPFTIWIKILPDKDN